MDLEKIRQSQAAKGLSVKSEAPSAKAPAATSAKAGKAPAKAKTATVTALCGCTVTLDPHDKLLEQKKTKQARKLCPECRQKANEEHNKKQKEEAAKKKEGQKKPRYKDGKREIGRLPYPARYTKTWKPDEQRWFCEMVVWVPPMGDLPAEVKTFTAHGSGSYNSEVYCDRAFRAWHEERQNAIKKDQAVQSPEHPESA